MQKRRIVAIIIFSFVSVVCAALMKFGIAEARTMGVLVQPVIFDLKIEKGESLEQSLKIKNLSDSILPLILGLKNFSSESQKIFDWIDLKDKHFILMPDEEITTNFSITAPQDAESRSYVLFLTIESQIAKTSNGARAITVVAAPLLIAVRDKNEEIINNIAIEEIILLPQSRSKIMEETVNKIFGIKNTSAENAIAIANSDSLNFKIKIRNNGKFHFNPQGALRLLDNQENLLAKTDFDGGAVLPGSFKEYYLKLNAGDVSVYDILRKNRIVADVEESKSKEFSFWIFDEKKALFFSFAALFFAVLVYVFYKFFGKMSCGKMKLYEFTREVSKFFSIFNNCSIFLRKRFASLFQGCGGKRIGSFFTGYPKKRNKVPKKPVKTGKKRKEVKKI